MQMLCHVIKLHSNVRPFRFTLIIFLITYNCPYFSGQSKPRPDRAPARRPQIEEDLAPRGAHRRLLLLLPVHLQRHHRQHPALGQHVPQLLGADAGRHTHQDRDRHHAHEVREKSPDLRRVCPMRYLLHCIRVHTSR